MESTMFPEVANDPNNSTLYLSDDHNLTRWESMAPLGSDEAVAAARSSFLLTRYIMYQIIIPIVFAVGVIGNIVSIAVLRRKRLRHTFDEVEASATSGLVSLALSDAAFCLVGLLPVLMPTGARVLIKDPSPWGVAAIYYHTYHGALLNLFLLTSTWLIITIAAARYTAIADPFHTRIAASVRQMTIVHLATFGIAVLVSVPQFFKYQVSHGYCEPAQPAVYCYWREPGRLFSLGWYPVAWHVVGTILPLITLVYCNCRLLLQIYHSLHGTPHRYSTSKITVILISIISLFLLLVCPSMGLTFWSEVIGHEWSSQHLYYFRTAVVVTNFTQSLNFAVNFVLYATISKQFRQTMVSSVVCRRRGGGATGTSQQKQLLRINMQTYKART